MMAECSLQMPSAGVALRRSLLLKLLALSLSLRFVCTTKISENSDDSGFQQQPYVGDLGLGGEWGLPDIVATVGKLISYQIPKYDTILGNFTNYKVTVATEDSLPPWLTFNEETSSIEGVPSKNIAGQIYNILVLADCIKPGSGRVISVRDNFNIRVSDKEDIWSSEDYTPLTQVPSNRDTDFRYARCQPNAAVTTATIIIDADEVSFLAKERVNLLRKISSHLGLPVSMVRLAPSHNDRPIFDDSALVAGPGDIKHPSHDGILVQWNVGCGNVYAEHMPVLELLEVTSSNGVMTKAIGYGIVGWHVTSKRPQQPRRLKRQLHISNPTATAMPSVVRPTGQPVPTMIVSDYKSYTDIPETRVVPTTTSAVSPDITKTSPLLPSWPYHKETSKVRVSILTKSPVPITTYVTITPTTVLSAMMSTVSVITSGSTPSRSVDDIEPSVGTGETTVQFHSTEMLPIWTTTVFKTDPALVTVFPSLIESITTLSATQSKLSTPKVTKRPPKTPKPDGKVTLTKWPNLAPVVSKPLAVLEAVVGNLFLFRIPDDLFMDKEDGGAEKLTIVFQRYDDQTVDPLSWIKMNDTSRTLYGLPLEHHIGMYHYQLAAVDRQGKLTKTPCNVSVQSYPASHKISHELSVTLDLDYDKVFYDLETRVNLINKIAAAFGDKDASKMTITRISPGSVVISWTNNTIPFEPCPEKQIRALLKHLLLPNGTINETFAKAMEPYRVLKAGATHLGSCAHLDSQETSKPDETTMVKPVVIEVKPREQPKSSLLLLILIPLVIISVLLLVLIFICIVCYKKQKKRRKEQDKLSGLHKGIPIIFADELDDKPDTPTSTLKSRSRDDDEKQSVPPPEYPRSKPASQSSTLRSDYKSPLLTDNEDDEEQDEREEELSNGTAPPTLPRQALQTRIE